MYDQCAGVHAATFASAVFKIAGDCLGLGFALPAPWDTDIDVEPLLHDTLCGGIYGSNDYTRLHSSSVTQNAVKSSRKGKKSSVLRSVFPPCADLKRRYPYLKKHPYLLPVAWAQRIVHYAGERRNSANNSVSGSLRLARERIALLLDAASFVELDVLNSDAGVVAGYGLIDGNPVYVYAQDFTVNGGSVGAAHARKVLKVMELAEKTGAPVLEPAPPPGNAHRSYTFRD